MRKNRWFRGPLLSGLFLSLLVAVSAAATVAQTPDTAAPPSSEARDALVSDLLYRVESAYNDGDASFLNKLLPLAYAGGPWDDLRFVEVPPESASLDDMLGYLSRRVPELGTEGLVLLTTGADLIQAGRIEIGEARPEAQIGTAYLRDSDASVLRQVTPTGWWSCTMDYLGDVNGCWQRYFNCMNPGSRPGGAPNEEWCKTLLDACLEIAGERYRICRRPEEY